MKKNSIPKLELVFLLLLTGMCPQAHATDDGRNASPQKTYAVDLTLGSATVLTFTEAVTSQTGVLFSYESAPRRRWNISWKRSSRDGDSVTRSSTASWC